jgi:hypothetical protein
LPGVRCPTHNIGHSLPQADTRTLRLLQRCRW